MARQALVLLETLLLMFMVVLAGVPAALFVVAGVGGWATSRYDDGAIRRRRSAPAG